jgi:L-iditol 2-dehydrogenase
MKAAVYYGPGDIRVEDRPDPTPQADNLIVDVICCAICGTDLKLATVGNPRCHPPRIIGHEMVGRITHIGSDVQGFSTGQRITLATTVACGTCLICSLGLGNLCPDSKPISYDYDGAFAQRLAVPPAAIRGRNVITVPDSVPDDAAALSEPLSCAINAQEIAGVKSGDTVLIVGGGPLGAIHVELAKALGAKQVMISELAKERLALLAGLKGVQLIDAANEDVAAIVKDRTAGLGADVVIICAPARQAHEQALQYARKGGSVSLFASLPKGSSDITLDSRAIHYGELRVVGVSDSRPQHVAKAVALMAQGKLDAQSLVTHRVPLEKIHEGIDLMKNKQSLKVLVKP